MTFLRYRDGSRKNWGTETSGDSLTVEQINCGAILRIADATEKMAARYTTLISEREWYERRYKEERAANERLNRSNAALRGHLKRAKQAVKKATGERQT